MHRCLLGNHAIDRVPSPLSVVHGPGGGCWCRIALGTTRINFSQRTQARQGKAGRNPEKLKICGPEKLRGWRRGERGAGRQVFRFPEKHRLASPEPWRASPGQGGPLRIRRIVRLPCLRSLTKSCGWPLCRNISQQAVSTLSRTQSGRESRRSTLRLMAAHPFRTQQH